MNTYILYCQETKESLYKLYAICRDVYEVVKEDETGIQVYSRLSKLGLIHSTFAIIDPCGAVMSCDLAIKKCEFDTNDRVTIETFQLKKIKR